MMRRCATPTLLLCATVAAVTPSASIEGQQRQAVADLTIGGIDGPSEGTFGDISGVAVHDDGTIYVLDAMAHKAKVYDASGRFLRSFGGEGDGPGEFRSLAQIAIRGDTVAVYDDRARRLTVLDHHGDLIETRAWQVPGWFTFGLEPFGNQAYILALSAMYSASPQPDDGKARLLLYRRDGRTPVTLLVTEGADELVERNGDVLTAADTPFGRRPVWAVARDGRIAFGRGESYELTVYRIQEDRSGASLRRVGSVSRDLPNRRVQDEDVRRFQARLLENDDLPERLRRAHARLLDAYDVPDTWPAYRKALFDDRGALWVERVWPTVTETRSVWDVFDREGSLTGSVTLEGDVDVQAIVGPYMYGVTRDSLGVAYLKRFLVRGGP